MAQILFEFEIAVPSINEQDQIIDIISALQFVTLLGSPLEQSAVSSDDMIAIQQQNRRLSAISDTILPLLLSGKLDVSQVVTQFSKRQR